ncbi:MAG: hypothetical protein QGG64_21470 [Candidatus Latescibacteria bacterium]|jgi:hypothetical protein|nr:hypothetical protein [Candidatus Latescibacterota bacterium]
MVVCNPELFEPTPRAQIKRAPNRGAYDRKTVYAIHQRILVSEHSAIQFYQKCGFERAGRKAPMRLPRTQS